MKKKFLIIGNINAVTYKDLFKNIRDNRIWFGNSESGSNKFFNIDKYGNTRSLRCICWYTNIKVAKKLFIFKETYNDKYLKYDNYDAIDINDYRKIPDNYYNNIGVPITFLDKMNMEQFEIIESISPILNNKKIYRRIIIKRKQ